MKLEQQVVSLELAQKLKELGVKQKSYFYWREGYHSEEHRFGNEWIKNGVFEGKFEIKAYPKPRMTTADVKWNERDLARLDETEVSAFTVAELGEMLQEICGGKGLRIDCTKDGEGWSICKSETERVYADTEADARAKILVYLLENGLIKL